MLLHHYTTKFEIFTQSHTTQPIYEQGWGWLTDFLVRLKSFSQWRLTSEPMAEYASEFTIFV